MGYYTEVGVPINEKQSWLIFGRHGFVDTAMSKEGGFTQTVSGGFNYFPSPGTVFKVEGQWIKSEGIESSVYINSAVGIWF